MAFYSWSCWGCCLMIRCIQQLFQLSVYTSNCNFFSSKCILKGSHSSWKIIEIQTCLQIREKSLNFLRNHQNLWKSLKKSCIFYQSLVEKSLNFEIDIPLARYIGKYILHIDYVLIHKKSHRKTFTDFLKTPNSGCKVQVQIGHM